MKQGGYTSDLKTSAELLDLLYRQLGIAAETGDRKRFKIGPTKRSAKDVTSFVDQLQEVLEGLLDENLRFEKVTLQAPAISVFDSAKADDFLRILRYLLEPNEVLLGLAEARVNGSIRTHWIAVTDKSVRGAGAGKLKSSGLLRAEFPVEDIRYVRGPDIEANAEATIGLYTKDEDFILRFPPQTEGDTQSIRNFARVLANYQKRVASELPPIDIPELTRTSHTAIET